MSLGAGAAAGCRSCVRLGPLLCAGAVAAGAAGKVFLLSGVYAGVICLRGTVLALLLGVAIWLKDLGICILSPKIMWLTFS